MNQNFLNHNSSKLHELKYALPLLTEDQRLAVYLRFWENYSILEVSDFLNTSWESANNLIENALSFLKTKLNEELELQIAA
jgi:DNA-directed RNA polymerase specialized sigma24 family protein